MRCCIRATTRRSNQMVNSVSSTSEHEDQHDLDEDQPPRVLAEHRRGPRRRAPGPRLAHERAGSCAASVRDGTTAPAPAPRSRRDGGPRPSSSAPRPRRRAGRRRRPAASTAPRVGGDGDELAVGDPEARGVPADTRATGRRPVAEVLVAVEHPPVVDQQLPGREHALAGPPRRGSVGARAGHGGGPRRGRRPRRRAPSSRRGPARRSGSRGRRPSPRRSPASTRPSGSAPGSRQHRGRTVRTRPSQSRKVPAFSATGATGKHHVGARGDRAGAAPRG